MSDTLAADIAVVIDRYATEQTRTNFMEVDKFARTYFNFDLNGSQTALSTTTISIPAQPMLKKHSKSDWPKNSTIHLPMIFILILM